jgi:hypothetical protein
MFEVAYALFSLLLQEELGLIATFTILILTSTKSQFFHLYWLL